VIGSAFGVLNDKDKRQVYDLHGVRGMNGHAAAAAGGRQHFGGHGMGGEMTPEELFELFFGMAGGNGGSFPSFQGLMAGRTFSFGNAGPRFQPQRQRQRRPDPDQSTGTFATLLQFLPILFFLWLSWASSSRDPAFGFTQTSRMSLERHTPRNVVYFMAPDDFGYYFKDDRRALRAFEQKVESNYIHLLQTRCSDELQVKQRRVGHAKWWGTSEEVAQANAMAVPSCDALRSLGIHT
jgi:hypothetical protein